MSVFIFSDLLYFSKILAVNLFSCYNNFSFEFGDTLLSFTFRDTLRVTLSKERERQIFCSSLWHMENCGIGVDPSDSDDCDSDHTSLLLICEINDPIVYSALYDALTSLEEPEEQVTSDSEDYRITDLLDTIGILSEPARRTSRSG